MGGESGGFVEAQVGFRILVGIHLDLLKEPVDDDKVKVEVWVQRRAEAMEKAHGSEGGIGWGRGTGFPQGGVESPVGGVKKRPGYAGRRGGQDMD